MLFNKLTAFGIGGDAGQPVREHLRATDIGEPVSSGGWRAETCKTPPRSVAFALHNGESDAAQIIEYLGRFALEYGKSPCVIRFARCLIGGITENNAVGHQFDIVGNFVLDHVTYVADPRGAEYVRSPLRLIKEYQCRGYGQGDCDDMTLFAASLLNALGFPVKIVAVKINGSSNYNHVLLQAMVAGEWKWFDGCNKDNPSKAWTDFISYQL